MGTQLPQKGCTAPNFPPMSIVAKRLDGSRCHLVRRWASAQATLCYIWGPSPLPTKGVEPLPQFSAHFYCGQTAGCIKMPLGMEVGLGLCDMFDVEPATTEKRAPPPHPIFGPCLLWPNGWMDKDAAWYGSRRCPGHMVLDGVPAPTKGTQQPPLFAVFGPCLLWPRSPISATAERLFVLP